MTLAAEIPSIRSAPWNEHLIDEHFRHQLPPHGGMMTTADRETAVTAAVLSLADPHSDNERSPAGRLVHLAAGLLGAPAAGVLLAEARAGDDAGAPLVAATAVVPGLREVLISGSEVGPGAECVRSGRPVVSDDLARDRHRWMRFTTKAAAAGVRAVTALPMRRRDDVAGALILLHREPGPAPDELRRVGQSLADAAAIGILHEWEVRHAERETDQLREALRTRIPIEQAKGALALYGGVDPEQAFAALRSRARHLGRPLGGLAADVVAGRADPSTIVVPRSG